MADDRGALIDGRRKAAVPGHPDHRRGLCPSGIFLTLQIESMHTLQDTLEPAITRVVENRKRPV